MSGQEDGEGPHSPDVSAGRDAFFAGRDVHLHFSPAAAGGARPAGRPAREWHPLDLGVHRAVDTSPDGEMPAYVRRPHDRELRDLLSAAPRARMVILVGGSCTGKTRACYEAVRECLADWPLFCPADAPELERLLTEQGNGEPTVVWLEEADRYLDGRVPSGSEAALRLLSVLASEPGPLLVIGSIQTRRWAELTAEPTGGAADPFRHARRLLEMRQARKIEVPEDFSSAGPADLRELALAGDRDPRIAAARRTGGEALQITQVLAGGVLMLERYRDPPDPGQYSRAVVRAAMDARRLGLEDPVPVSLLQEAAAGYLTPSQRSAPAGWFHAALAAAAEPVRGVAALTPVRRGPGAGDPDGYVLHDYLNEYAQRTREAVGPPASLWEALVSHTASIAGLTWVAVEARRRGLYRYAALAAARAAAAGDSGSVRFVARLLDETGRAEECVDWLLPFAEAGDPDMMLLLSEELGKTRRKEKDTESFSWRVRAAEAGSASAIREFIRQYQILGLADAVAAWQEKLAGLSGSQPAAPARHEPAAPARQEYVDELSGFTAELTGASHEEETRALWSRASAGDPEAMENLGNRLMRAQRTGEAAGWLARAADAGRYRAAWDLAEILHQDGRDEEALAVIQRAAACWGDHFSSLDGICPLLRAVGGESSVESFLAAAAEAGNSTATAYFASVLRRQGRPAEAIRLLEPAAEKKNLTAMEFLGAMLEETGQGTAARAWYQCVDQAVSVNEVFLLASQLEGSGWPDRALVRYGHATECGRTDVMTFWIDLLVLMGRTEESERLQAYGIEAGGHTAQPWQVPSSQPIAGSPGAD